MRNLISDLAPDEYQKPMTGDWGKIEVRACPDTAGIGQGCCGLPLLSHTPAYTHLLGDCPVWSAFWGG